MNEQFSFISGSEEETAAFGRRLSAIARKGDVFALFGTLGMGKSVLARSFIQSLTNAEEVPSPTFTLVQTYEAQNFEIYHYDLYRLKSPDEIYEIGMEDALYSGVSLIEWPEQMGAYLPRDMFKVTFTPKGDKREIIIESISPEKQARLTLLGMIK